MPGRSIVFPRGIIRSAGALVWRFAPGVQPVTPGKPISPDDIQVLLVHRPRYHDWSWPKGKAERNEPLPVSAVREVEEETGRVVSLGAPLTTQRYRLGSGHIKEVYYWVGQLMSESNPARATRRPVVYAPKKEIDIAKWVSPDSAREMITRKGDRRLLMELINRGRRGELQTSTLVLLRHAKAISRGRWAGAEMDRPLTRVGVAQSLDLVEMLSAFGVAKVVTSPWLRCEQTVLPYASLGVAPITRDDVLTEDSIADKPEQASKLISRIIGGKRSSTAVCYHGPGLPALQKPVRALSSRRVLAEMDGTNPGLRKAELMVVHITHTETPRVMDAERHHPLTKLRLS